MYSKYFYKPTAAVHPHAPGPAGWFFVNVVVRDSEARVPLLAPAPLCAPLSAITSGITPRPGTAAAAEEQQGLAVPLPLCNVGYYFGGDGHAILKVKLDQASALAVLPWEAGPHAKQLLEPFSADLGVSWHRPEASTTSATMMQLTSTPLAVKLGFAHISLLQSALSLLASPEPPAAGTPASAAGGSSTGGVAANMPGPPLGDTWPDGPGVAPSPLEASTSRLESGTTAAAIDEEDPPSGMHPLPGEQRLRLQKAVVQVCRVFRRLGCPPHPPFAGTLTPNTCEIGSKQHWPPLGLLLTPSRSLLLTADPGLHAYPAGRPPLAQHRRVAGAPTLPGENSTTLNSSV